jgi:hypothetical protein
VSGFREGFTTVGNAIAAYLTQGLDAAFGQLTTRGLGLTPVAVSDEISFAATADIPFGAGWPTLAGYIFIPQAYRIVFTDLSGVHAVNPAAGIGTVSPFTNILPAQSIQTAANLNTMIANGSGNGENAQTLISAANNFAIMPELTTAPTVRVTVACSPGAVCKLR